MERQNHPYDQGYWARYDGKPRPSELPGNLLARQGWDDCDAEIDAETRAVSRIS